MKNVTPIAERVILDLCGGTGAWSRPYSMAGYDVRNITLPCHDVKTYLPPEKVYGILAAPPCSEFSIAKGSLPRDFESGFEIVKVCLEIIWQVRLRCKLQFWCLENPKGFLRQFLGKPACTVRYWWYGDGLDKPTDLWGYFNPPKRRYNEPPGLLQPVQNMPSLGAIKRAITPSGFAEAFFQANQ